MITIASYSTPLEAQIAKAKLDSEEIPAFLADEHTVNAQWLYSHAMGGVRLQVPDSFAAEAYELLEIDRSQDLVREQGETQRQCKLCGSTNVEPLTKGKKMAFVVFLFFNFPLWPFKRQVICKDCGATSDLHT